VAKLNEVPDITDLQSFSFGRLIRIASEALSSVTTDEKIVFEETFNLNWNKFVEMILALVTKSYAQIYSVFQKLSCLRDFSTLEGANWAALSTLNQEVKSAKVQSIWFVS